MALSVNYDQVLISRFLLAVASSIFNVRRLEGCLRIVSILNFTCVRILLV